MPFREGTRLTVRARRVPAWAAAFAIVLGSLVLLAWRLHWAAITAPIAMAGPMKGNTALGLVFLGIALWGSRAPRERPLARRVALVSAGVALAIGLATLLEYATGVSFGIDQALARDEFTAPWSGAPGRMAVVTALLFVLSGLAVLLLDVPRLVRIAQGAALTTLGISSAIVVGYLYGVAPTGTLGLYAHMPLHTGLGLLVVAIGLLCLRPERAPLLTLVSDGPGGFVMRRMLPTALFLFVLLGWLRLHPGPVFAGDFGTALLVVSGIVLVTAIMWVGARALDRTDADRRRALDESGRATRFLDSIIENLPLMVFVKDAAALRFVRFNRAGEELLGFLRSDLIGKNDYDFFPQDEADFFTQKDRTVLAEGRMLDIAEEPIETRAHGRRILHTRKVPILDADGAPEYLLGISEDVTERKQAEERIHVLNEHLQRRTEELETANQELEAFSYSVSHDLRAPLRHIGGFAEMLRHHSAAVLDDRSRGYLDKMAQASVRMGELIEDLLTFSRMSRTDMHWESVDLEVLVADVRRELARDTEGRAIEWAIAPLPRVDGDPAMLRIVIVNLLANAIKYTRSRAQARIEVGARDEAGHTVVFVRDNGAGFDEAYAHKLFGVFQRLHGADEFEGTGIGLANVRRIIARHGGRAWAEGVVDRGATFYVSLPHRKEAET